MVLWKIDCPIDMCDYLLTVDMKEASFGYVSGFCYLVDIRKPGNIEWRPDLEVLNIREMDTFPNFAQNPVISDSSTSSKTSGS